MVKELEYLTVAHGFDSHWKAHTPVISPEIK